MGISHSLVSVVVRLDFFPLRGNPYNGNKVERHFCLKINTRDDSAQLSRDSCAELSLDGGKIYLILYDRLQSVCWKFLNMKATMMQLKPYICRSHLFLPIELLVLIIFFIYFPQVPRQTTFSYLRFEVFHKYIDLIFLLVG